MRLIFLILSCTALSLTAQHTSKLGRFSIEYSKACAPVTVHITKSDNLGNISRQYSYERGLIETTDTVHTFGSYGTYTIIQYLGLDIQPKSDTLLFEVFEPLPPQFNILQCSETEIMLDITDDHYDYYLITFSNSDTLVYRKNDSNPTHDYGQSSGSVSVYGYFDDGFDNCADRTTSFNLPPPSPVSVSSVRLIEGCEGDLYINLQLSSISPFSEYEIQLNQGSQSYETIFSGIITENTLTLPISYDPSQSTYCVNVLINNTCSGLPRSHVETCQTSTYQVQNLSGTYASYSNENILIHLGNPSPNVVEIARKSGQSKNFSVLIETSDDYLDPIPSLWRPFQYRLDLTDTCDNLRDSIFIAAPYIKIADKDVQENRVYLNETPPVNQLGNSTQSILFYNADSTITIENEFSSEVQLPSGIGSIVHFSVKYSYETAIVYSNEVSTEYNYVIHVPKAFTPNGDGLNDQLELFGLPSEDFKILIFDKWGKVIHTATENPVWNGRKGKEKMNEGTYLYQLRFHIETGELKTQVGTFAIIKN